MSYIVTRVWNCHGSKDYLVAWDIILGPCWSGSKDAAIRFPGPAAALEALDTAEAVCRPVPWIVPDIGHGRLYITPI